MMIGRTISHYKITAKLGAGGMGEVYLATDTQLDRRVALKFLPETLQTDPDARARLIREAKAASKLNHPSILTVHAVEKADGKDFIVMEHVQGVSPGEFIIGTKPSIDDLLGVAIQIGEGLSKAHQAGVVHRDLKPANILIDSEGRAKILDFGVAKLKGATRLTRTGSIVGTATYMSPEQAQGQDADHRSDLFSLGAVLYEMLTGRPPFDGDHEAAVIYSLINEEALPLARYVPKVPDELQRIVSKCLAKRPNERYQSAADLVVDLQAVRRLGTAVSAPSAPSKRKMLAVLPFENLGRTEDEYFADGITGEIISRLSAVAELGVISRTSTMQYKDTHKPMRQIGAELGADYILEGSVRWAKSSSGPSRIRITPQLIQVSDDTHLWSDRYDRVMDDVFAIQSDIAEQVFNQLDITILEPNRRILEAKPTENLDAYHDYLRGMDYARRPDYLKEDFDLAVQMFGRAIKLDPDFALAYAQLADSHSCLYFFGYDQTEKCRSASRMAAQRALALQPALPEAHFASGLYYYRCLKDYDRALEELSVAARSLPNDSYLMTAIAAVYRRQRGYDAGAAEQFVKAFELSPRNAGIAGEIAYTYTASRQYARAEEYYDRCIALAPDQVNVYTMRAGHYWLWSGSTQKARATLEQIPKGKALVATLEWLTQELYERDYRAALERLANYRVDFAETQFWSFATSQWEGLFHLFLNEPEQSRKAYKSARKLLQAKAEENPDDARIHSSLGLVNAGLGLKSEAVRAGRVATDLIPPAKDSFASTIRELDLALIYTMIGEHDSALDLINHLLSVPSWLSIPVLRLDPRWDPLREHSRFRALLEKEDVVFL